MCNIYFGFIRKNTKIFFFFFFLFHPLETFRFVDFFSYFIIVITVIIRRIKIYLRFLFKTYSINIQLIYKKYVTSCKTLNYRIIAFDNVKS